MVDNWITDVKLSYHSSASKSVENKICINHFFQATKHFGIRVLGALSLNRICTMICFWNFPCFYLLIIPIMTISSLQAALFDYTRPDAGWRLPFH